MWKKWNGTKIWDLQLIYFDMQRISKILVILWIYDIYKLVILWTYYTCALWTCEVVFFMIFVNLSICESLVFVNLWSCHIVNLFTDRILNFDRYQVFSTSNFRFDVFEITTSFMFLELPFPISFSIKKNMEAKWF
jgi:hypothetical protein